MVTKEKQVYLKFQLVTLILSLLFISSSHGADIVNQYRPRIAMNSKGNFIVVWRQNNSIYAKYFINNLGDKSKEFKISTTADDNLNPAVIIDKENNVTVVWEKKYGKNFRIYLRRYKNGVEPVGDSFSVTDKNIPGNQFRPGIATLPTGKILVVWVDYRNSNPDIFGQLYDKNLYRIGTNFIINDDTTSAIQALPTVATGKDKFVVAWEDRRIPFAFIFCQVIGSDGIKIGENFEINNDKKGSSWGAIASIAVRETGEFMIAWKDYRNGDSDIYAQMCDRNNQKIGHNIKVNDDAGPGWQRLPSIAVNNYGNFIIAWEDYRNDSLKNQMGDIYAQRLDAKAIPIHNNFKVNDSNEPSSQKAPVVCTDRRNVTAIVWEDRRSGKYLEVYLQYMRNFNKLMNDIKLSKNYHQ